MAKTKKTPEMIKEELHKLGEQVTWHDITEGCNIYIGGTSKYFNTGEWRTDTPVFIAEKCKQCLLCTPACPDSAIPVADKKRLDFDFDHCKGCGICAKVCPFGAIEMKRGEK